MTETYVNPESFDEMHSQHEIPMKVHVVNAHEMQSHAAVAVRETEAEHAACFTGTAIPVGAQISPNNPMQPFLQLDPKRKRAIIVINGAQNVALCHSAQQAQQMVSGNANADEGCAIAGPAVIEYKGTAPLWLVALAAAPAAGQCGVVSERWA